MGALLVPLEEEPAPGVRVGGPHRRQNRRTGCAQRREDERHLRTGGEDRHRLLRRSHDDDVVGGAVARRELSGGERAGRRVTVEGDILATLLQVRDQPSGEGFSFEELVDQVAMLFLAGHETSASALSWALHLLAHSPSVQERLHQEAVALFDPNEDDPSAIKDLALARNVFREALRLFPPVGFLARESAQACTMRDKQVPSRASVVISPWLIQRHRELWARPDEFDPDRFDTSPDAVPPEDTALPVRESLRKAYLPFGMGPRVCIGAAFAQQEAALILATLAREFRFEPVPGHVPEPVGRLTIRAENGIRLKVFQREGGVSP